MKTIIALIIIFFGAFNNSNAIIIFQDSFDSCTTGCTVGASEPNSAAWTQWVTDGLSATHDSVTHYSGEITSSGRGGSGKSLKLWRHSDSWTGSASYAGALVMSAPSSYSNFYLRFYAKVSGSMSFPADVKMFRLNTTGASGELYVNLNNYGSGTFLWVWGGSGDSSINTELLTPTETASLFDGEWHCWQFQFNLSTNTVNFWADGVLLGSITDSRLDGAWDSLLQHWPLGNAQDGSWQSSWQPFEVDDIIIATSKLETDPDESTPASSPFFGGAIISGATLQ